ncbi:MAG TPA: tRNA (adenosine(37)-N6)-threonylcarbamoyltransferase complex dimerization subunit type 1 TsaB [Solirubrobacteraceae bacterium]|jgi:tRNA threonylcarbamoyladenosine biosynthesis protein TsaB|nr:tRNA (adenosine(37)-N6)-threonylcarbamoyltransferase complex dimerization subunit type 1 TsaB [Solirubrobacteraceae bacterium]
MRVLAFDTATALTAVALRDIETDANVCLRATLDVAAVDDPPAGGRPGHAQKLLALIHDLLDRGEAGWDMIDRIAVGVGPGTFTGLRIGIATAQALAAATDTPLVGVSTLRSLALAAHDRQSASATLAVIDARRGEAFVAGWSAGSDPLIVEPALNPCVLTPEQLARVAADSSPDTLAVGDGAVKFRDILERAGFDVPVAESPLHRTSARVHCRLAVMGEPSEDGTVEPQYLRLPDAEISSKS